MDKIISTGEVIYYYDTEKVEPEVLQSVCCGSFINIETGDLYYYTPSSKQPSYAVHKDKADAEVALEKFIEFRKHVAEAQAAIDAEREALGNINLKQELSGILYAPAEGDKE